VERGTGAKAAIPGFAVAGKTGTAQKAGVGGYIAGRHVPNFAGFAPAEHPRCVAVAVIEEPQGHYYAADVAAPLFQRVVAQALGILRIAPREQQVPASVLAEAAPPSPPVAYPAGVVPVSHRSAGAVFPAAVALASDVAAAETQPAAAPSGRTPSVLGMSARQALALFARAGALARIQGTGFVVSQDPPAGAPLRAGDVHTLILDDRAPAASGEARRAGGNPPPPSGP